MYSFVKEIFRLILNLNHFLTNKLTKIYHYV